MDVTLSILVDKPKLYVYAIEIGISGRTSNPKYNFGRWSKMNLKSFSYLLPKLQNQLSKNLLKFTE